MKNEQNNHNLDEICSCNVNMKKIVSMCVLRMINILLNNFTKRKNDEVCMQSANKKRKLATLV